MGAQPSKPEAASEKVLAGRVERILLAEEENDTRQNEKVEHNRDHAKREPEGLSIQQMESWQGALLKDPTNKYSIQGFNEGLDRLSDH